MVFMFVVCSEVYLASIISPSLLGVDLQTSIND